jgi:hypothetical protein
MRVLHINEYMHAAGGQSQSPQPTVFTDWSALYFSEGFLLCPVLRSSDVNLASYEKAEAVKFCAYIYMLEGENAYNAVRPGYFEDKCVPLLGGIQLQALPKT